ncbi:copper resistance D family protein [Paenibacillus sp. B01]|uniref:copper resistance D family protein n=1 Tax=Paenibacillus sp. B01 TaxID=2660554 RepID=UPI00129B9E27|nr:CopD family protein [Paenibacillus sp. B01]QGG55049.1 hypothetical protein GE073_05270 [Paenibacillus sp. B01]
MTLVAWISEALLYLCFSLIAGYSIMNLVPQCYRPTINIPTRVIFISIAAIPILALMPVLRIVFFFSEDIGFWLTLKNVLFSFEEGKAYLKIMTSSFLLLWFIYKNSFENRRQSYIIIGLLTFVMALILSSASHLASLYGWLGAIGHFAHFLSIIVWAGTLLVTGFFATNLNHWLVFLRWFTPLAVACLVMISASGFLMMQAIVPSYIDSWVLSYGQALLLKHLAIIPLLVFAFMNGVMFRFKQKRNPDWNPLYSLRMEGGAILLVFAITGFMGQQSPPHDVSLTVREAGVAQWFDYFVGEPVTEEIDLMLSFNGLSFGLGISSIILMGSLFYMSWKKRGWRWTQLLGLLFVSSAYLAIMSATTFR